MMEWGKLAAEHRRLALLAKLGLESEPQWVGDSLKLIRNHTQACINEMNQPKLDHDSLRECLRCLMSEILTAQEFYEEMKLRPDVRKVEKESYALAG
jgi:hypothetical protein